MIKKQNLWFVTLFSLILVLSIYYVTMPNDLLKEKNNELVAVGEEKVEVEEATSLVAMRVSLEEERQNLLDDLQKQLVSETLGTEEKNNLYEQLKYLNEIQGKEEDIEKEIKDKYKVSCFVKIDNANAEVVCISDQHTSSLANNIMRLIQSKYKSKMFVTVKFQKK